MSLMEEDTYFEDYERRSREHLRILLKGHELLLDSKPPYVIGSFCLSGPICETKWKQRPDLELWQAVSVWMGIDPDSIGTSATRAFAFLDELRPLFPLLPSAIPARYWAALWQVGLDVVSGFLPVQIRAQNPHRSQARFDEFADIMDQRRVGRISDDFGWLPEGAVLFPYEPGHVPAIALPDLATKDEPEQRYFGDEKPPYRWPWGRHETDLLRQLYGAATLWRTEDEGGRYNPLDPDTAPTNEQVEAWLERHGVVSAKVREVMASILRADGLPKGRRRASDSPRAGKGSKE